MFRGVFVGRGVAAANVTAGHAKAQMQPGGANAKAILTAVGAGNYIVNLIEMCACGRHIALFPSLHAATEAQSHREINKRPGMDCLSFYLCVSAPQWLSLDDVQINARIHPPSTGTEVPVI